MAESSVTFTVFTPTYNRGATLARVCDSLRTQTFRDFEWLIVDDGSTDDTRQRVQAFQATADFPIRYLWQENRHKKSAFNHGVREAHGALFVALDSDDQLFPDTLARLHRVWLSIPAPDRENYSAVTGLCARPDGSIVGDCYPQDQIDGTPQEMHYKYKIRGEKFGFQRTDVLRRFPFPEDIPGFVPESIVWSAIGQQGYKTRFVNEVMRVYHDSPDSLSRQGAVNARTHALGLYLLARDILNNSLCWFFYQPWEFLMAGARYTRFALHLHHDRRKPPEGFRGLNGLGARALAVLMAPLGLVMYWRDCLRARPHAVGPDGASA